MLVLTDIAPIPDEFRAMIAASGALGNGKSCSAWAGEHRKHRYSAEALKRSFGRIQAHLSHSSSVASGLHAAHASAGGARSRAISDRISANICRDTATSAHLEGDIAAIADDLRTDLDQLLLRLVSDHGFAAFRIASVHPPA
jgi:hypothetical protein